MKACFHVLCKLASNSACKTAYMNIGDRIKSSREAKGLSQRELGKRVGVQSQSVSQWESGTTKALRPENLLAVADELGVSIRWLISGRGARDPSIPAAELIASASDEHGLGPLSVEEADLVVAWRSWSPEIRKHIEILMLDTSLRRNGIPPQFLNGNRSDQKRFDRDVERRQKKARKKDPEKPKAPD